MNAEYLRNGLAPRLQLPEERPVTQADYAEHLPVSLEILRSIKVSEVSEDDIPLLLVLVLEHLYIGYIVEDYVSYLVSTEQHWSTREHFEAAATIVKQLSWDKLPQLLETHFEAIWQLLVPSLQNWSDNPAAANSASVLFARLDGSVAGAHFAKLFPFILRWLDSWLVAPRTLAGGILNVLTKQIPRKDFTVYGREQVLYDALKGAINAQEAQVLEVSLGPLLQLLRMISEGETEGPSNVRKGDQFINLVFARIDLESGMEKKSLLCRLLEGTWKLLEQGVLRWISRLSLLLQSELPVPGEHCLKLLELWTNVCYEYPLAAARECRMLLPTLFQLAWKWSHDQAGSHITREVLERVLLAQMKTDPKSFSLLTKGLKDADMNAKFQELVSGILEETLAACRATESETGNVKVVVDKQ